MVEGQNPHRWLPGDHLLGVALERHDGRLRSELERPGLQLGEDLSVPDVETVEEPYGADTPAGWVQGVRGPCV